MTEQQIGMEYEVEGMLEGVEEKCQEPADVDLPEPESVNSDSGVKIRGVDTFLIQIPKHTRLLRICC